MMLIKPNGGKLNKHHRDTDAVLEFRFELTWLREVEWLIRLGGLTQCSPQVHRAGLQLELVPAQMYAGWRKHQRGKMADWRWVLSAWGVARVAVISCLQTAFFRQHGCSTNDTNAKYNSRAAQMYREKIRQLANAALSRYGTDVSLQLLLLLRHVCPDDVLHKRARLVQRP